jgi:Tol biopolymer transport system component
VIGTTFSHYQIIEKLGEGGMGVVYRAVDTRLQRQVAIKVLPPGMMADEERFRRFVQEARSASSLNHPNIVTVYDVGFVAGVHFIAMEYMPGRTLDRLIGRKGLRLKETLKYSVQIADALATAHRAGMVHRDLKPANVWISDSGSVKVLDFGLAKLTERGEAPSVLTKTDESPRTEPGTIVGTAAYMSPEQAEGRPLDARSDVFSFGAVLYEMVTGRRAFDAQTNVATLSAILRDEPRPLSEVSESVPRELERIITHCLRKDPNRRFQHLDDVRTLLEELAEESDSGKLAAAPHAPTRADRKWLPVSAAAAALLVMTTAGIVWWLTRDRGPATAQASAPTRLTFDSGLTTDPALSSDGKLVAYASDRAGEGSLDLWIQNVDSGETNRLTSDAADEREPAFSPDGSKIVFRSERDGGGIYIIPSIGGEPRLLATLGRRPRFSPDGTLVAYYFGPGGADLAGTTSSELRVVGSTGGAPRQIQPKDVDVASHPLWAPDGRHLLFFGIRFQDRRGPALYSDWWVMPLDGSNAVGTGAFEVLRRRELRVFGDDVLIPTPSDWTDDRVVFSGQVGDSKNVWQVRLAPGTFQAMADAERLTTGTSLELQPSLVRSRQGTSPSGSRLAFASLTSTLNVWSLPIESDQGKPVGDAQRLTASSYDGQPSLSGDGKRLVFTSSRSGNLDIWLKDLASGRETPLTFGPAAEFGPEITADGNTVFYQLIDGENWSLYSVPIAMGGQPGVPQRVCQNCPRLWDPSSDGRKILFNYKSPRDTVGLFELDNGRKTELLKHSSHTLVRVRFSPDDRWISVVAITGQGRSRIYIVPFLGGSTTNSGPGEDEWIAITDNQAFYDKPVWSPDGTLLYYVSDQDGFRCIWAQRLDPATKQPVGRPFDVYHSHRARQSLLNADILKLEIAVAPGRLIFPLGEMAGNIWMANLR